MALVIARGADVSAGTTARSSLFSLLVARSEDHRPIETRAAMAKMLLRAGANPNGVPGGTPPLCDAVRARDGMMVELLADNGADTERLDADGMAPLHYAVREGDGDIVQLLLKKGADVNVRDAMGNTPMDQVASSGAPNRVKQILSEHGGT